MTGDGARSGKGTDAAGDVEPDYRFTLANERTFLAWQRTALGLLAAAVAVIQFVPSLSVPGARHALGLMLGALAIAAAIIGIRRWSQTERAMRRGEPMPRQPSPVYIGIGLVLVTLLALGLVLTKAMTG
jgi:inner membrane protein YidH